MIDIAGMRLYNFAMRWFRRLFLIFFVPVLFLIFVGSSLGIGAIPEAPDGMVLIPGGRFWMGLDTLPEDSPWGQEDAHPKHSVALPSFLIDRYEVTHGDYIRFDDAHHDSDRAADVPVSDVDWNDADGYCRSIGKRLPTEAEWEKAARGVDGRVYPWGNIFDSKKANIGASPKPVGFFPDDRSPYGVFDMAGNVSEWTDSWYRPYPGSLHHSADYGIFQKVVRGGSFNVNRHFADEMFLQVTFRNYNRPNISGPDNGFRCAKSRPEKP